MHTHARAPLTCPLFRTGAVGDLDGDGHLDAVISVNYIGQITDETGIHIRNEAETRVFKINLRDVMLEKRLVPVNVTLGGGMKSVKNAGGSILNAQFLPEHQQLWLSYMGTAGNAVYGSRH